MKGDFSKNTFNAKKHFHDVLMQQGRVLLDTDWNEQAEITTHRVETGTEDIIGDAGAPLHNAGFEIITVNDNGIISTPGTNLRIGPGHFYADGILCENDAPVLFASQPDFNSTALPVAAGTYIFYLDVWLRHITALEDAQIREVALGGPDTTTRTRTIWQVRFKETTAAANCAAGLPADITNPSTGTLNARSEEPSNTADPCGLAESGGYRRLENQLYRVEIHTASANRANASFKWSRDNGCVVVKWEKQDTADLNKLMVSNTGRDELLGFRAGDWIELIDDRTDLLGLPGVLAELLKVEGDVLIIKSSTIKDPDNPGATSVTINNRRNPRIRRWDSAGDLKLNTNNTTWITLEDGVQVKFNEGSYKTGDYWLIPARTAIADIEWAFTEPQPPRGIQHHFSELAILKLDATGWTLISDCRPLFPPLTELISLYYVSGDGQEAMPGNAIPRSLKVGVANGQWPVKNAKVRFELLPDTTIPLPDDVLGIKDSAGNPVWNAVNVIFIDVTTGEDGIASCEWKLGRMKPRQVKARLIDGAGIPFDDRLHLSVIFNANLSIADNVFYQSTCTKWPDPAPDTVAQALDLLCNRESSKRSCTVTVGKNGGQFDTLLKALTALNTDDSSEICICLLPGETHVIDEDIQINHSKGTIKISGCKASIIMTAALVNLIAGKIILQGFMLITSGDKKSQIILGANEVDINNCDLGRIAKSSKESPFVLINPLSKTPAIVRLHSNRIGATIKSENSTNPNQGRTDDALALANGVGGWMENNVVTGIVRLQYNKDGFEYPRWKNDADEKLLFDKLTNSIAKGTGELHMRGNTFENVFTNIFVRPGADFVPVYEHFFISDNIFKGTELEFVSNFADNQSSFISTWMNLCNNHFPELKNRDNNTLAYAMGDSGMLIGNVGPENIKFHIDAKFKRSQKAPTLITIL
jgi:hypothetical protein